MYQFIHVESYGRISSSNGKKQSARNVAAEAERQLHGCNHIEDPKPYIHLYGCSPSQAVKQAEERADIAKDKIGRKLRKDAQIIVCGVASYPVPLAQLDPSDPQLNEWLKLTHEFLLGKYGDKYKNLSFHCDETYPHVHFSLLPDLKKDGEFNISQVHDGVKARNEVETNRAKDKVRAYKEAMRGFQQEYYEKVGIPCGLCREGPKKRRLTRKQWQIEKATAQRQAEAFDKIKLAEYSLHESQLEQDELKQSKIKSEEIIALAEAQHAKAKREIEKFITLRVKGDNGVFSLLTNQIKKLKNNVKELLSNVKTLKSRNTGLCDEVSSLEKENNKLRTQNLKLSYQNDLRFKGIKQLKNELFYVLELAKSGQFRKINEISNNNNNNNQEYQS